MNFTPSLLRSGLFGLVGLRDGYQTEYQIVTAANQATSSGMYYQDYHPLVTVAHLHQVAPGGLSDADFNTWWADLTRAAIVKYVGAVMRRYEVPSVFENLRLYNFATVLDDPMTMSGNAFVGLEIELAHVNNIKVVLDSIGLLFNGTLTDKTFYLFHSSQAAAITTITASATANTETWTALTDKVMNFVNDTYVGGRFYIGYKQQDLGTVRPLKRDWDCGNIKRYASLFSVRPFQVSDFTGTTLFDIDDIDYTSDTYGLNLELSSVNDVTKQILTQKSAFTDLIGTGVAVEVLERLANSTRDNEVKKETRDLAFAELNKDGGDLRGRLESIIKQVRIDMQLDEVTLPRRSLIDNYTAQ
jgi:hypothetical protein